MAFCNQCGANNADGAKFCNACGAPLPSAAGQSAPTAGPAWKTAPGGEPAGPAAPAGQPAWQSASAGQQAWAGPGPHGMTKGTKPRGWGGFFSAIVALVGMMAFEAISAGIISATYMDLFDLSDAMSMFGSNDLKNAMTLSFVLVIAAAVLFLLAKKAAGKMVSILSLVVYLFILFTLCDKVGVELLDVVGIGFWVTVVGHAGMILG